MKTFIALFLIPLATLAQNEPIDANALRDRAFQMAKATVEFLATDKKTYGYQSRTLCPECVSYPGLKAFIVQQKLTKADELVNETERWVTAPATAAKMPATALAELRAQLMSRVTTGRDRQHRRSLASFAAYESKMKQLANGENAPTIAINTAQPVSQPADAANTPDYDPGTASEEIVVPADEPKSTGNSWLSKSGLALIFSLLSLGLAGWLLASRRKEPGRGAFTEGGNDMKVAQLNDELVHVKADLRRTIDLNGGLKSRLEQLENQVAVLQKAVSVTSAVSASAMGASGNIGATTEKETSTARPQAAMSSGSRQQAQVGPSAPTGASPAGQPLSSTPKSPTAAPPPAPENRPRATGSDAGGQTGPSILYARTVDLGDGFSVDSLSEKTSERPMVYQIQLQGPAQATFRVAEDPYAQRLALSDPYSYLNDACDYNSQPASNSRILTTKPGRLVLQSNKWAITEKAQIAFS